MTVEDKVIFPRQDGHPGTPYYYKDEVQGWFKRCMEDYPGNENNYDIILMAETRIWFEKWFGQFKEIKL